MIRCEVFALIGLVAACSVDPPAPSILADTSPARIVSLDFCADQYVLKLADREDILALSPEAIMDHSYMREAAVGIRTVRPLAEDALALEPDLIVRSYGGGPNAQAFFEGAGVPVLQIGWAGDFATIKQVSLDVAEGLGVPERGERLVAEIDARLMVLAQKAQTRKNGSVLYMTPTGVTTGSGSLVDEIISVIGLSNFETRPGWHTLPLERLASEQPDMVAASFYKSEALSHDIWSAARHPIARAQLAARPGIELEGAWTACGAWFTLDAAEALASATGTARP